MKKTSHRMGEKSMQITYLLRDLYQEHVKNIYNSTIKSRSNLKIGKGHSCKENRQKAHKKNVNSDNKEVVLYTNCDG